MLIWLQRDVEVPVLVLAGLILLAVVGLVKLLWFVAELGSAARDNPAAESDRDAREPEWPT